MALIIVFWVPTILLAWVYIGYPLLAAVFARVAPIRLSADGPVPDVSVAIAVHDGATQIAERIADAFAQESSGARIVEVVVGSDGSGDGTDTIVAELARAEPRLRFLSLPRAGQTPTQHALFETARGDVIVLTDAETRFAPGCLAELAGVFRDPRVGCATGRLSWTTEEATATSRSEGVYWRYELLVRDLENRAGWLTAVTGALVAVRHSSFRPVPARSSMDELLPLYVREEGQLVVYVPRARATDRPILDLAEQFRTRERIATRGIYANLSMLRRLSLRRMPGVVIAIISHKLLRWATPWLLLVPALIGVALALQGEVAYAVAPLGLGAGLAAAAAAQLLSPGGNDLPRVLAFARSFTVVNVAFALGWVGVLRGRRFETWKPASATHEFD